MTQSDEAIPLFIEDLTFRYRIRETPAIENLTLALHPGELLLVAGASGCGKTTLMRCINGLILVPILMVAYDAVVARSGR